MECSTCHTPLTGVLDTFGDIHTPLCLGCFFAEPDISQELDDLEKYLDDLESDLSFAQDKVDALQGDIDEIQAKIKSLKTNGPPKTITKGKLEKWTQQVAA